MLLTYRWLSVLCWPTGSPEGSGVSVEVQEAVTQPNQVQIPITIPLPSKLELKGDLATNWKKFHHAWNNYEIAAHLKDPGHPTVNKSLRTATLLTWLIVKKSSPKNLLADYRSTVSRLSVDCRPTVSRLSAVCWPSVGRQSAQVPIMSTQSFPRTH